MIQFACPGCQARLRAPPAAAGKSGRCHQCGGAVRVPRPVPAGEGDPVPAQARRDADPPRGRGRAVWFGVGVLSGAFGLLAVILALAVERNAGGGTAAVPHPAAAPARPDPDAAAKERFAALVRRVRDRLPPVPGELLPEESRFDWDLKGSSEVTFAAEAAPDPAVAVTYEVRPPGGAVGFGVRMNGRVDIVSKQEVRSPDSPFPTQSTRNIGLLLDMEAVGTAAYEYRDGRWALEDVKLVTTSCYVRSHTDIEKDFYSAIMANELNRDPARVRGKTILLNGGSAMGLVRVLREAGGP